MEFRDEFRKFLGPTLLVLISFLVARIITWLNRKNRNRIKRKLQTKNLNNLTSEEKGYLAKFILEGSNTIHVGIDDGIMGGLVAKGICYAASQTFNILNGRPFNLQPWAREYLDANRSLLTGHDGKPLTPRQKLHKEYF